MSDKIEVLGSQKIATDGPFRLAMKIHFVGIAGEYEGYDAHADVDLPPGEVPDDATVMKMIEAAQAQLGGNFRPATRAEFVRDVLIEQIGADMNFAIPGPVDFRLLPR